MMLPKKTAKVDQELSLAQRRAYMQLPLEERRKRLAAQADQMAEHYEQEQSAQSASPGREGTLSSPNPVIPQRGEIWLVNFDPTVGTEIKRRVLQWW